LVIVVGVDAVVLLMVIRWGRASRRASRRAADEKMTKSILTMRLSPRMWRACCPA
jgi:hypothetical protein